MAGSVSQATEARAEWAEPAGETVLNQPPPFADFNLAALDAPLREQAAGGEPAPALLRFGSTWGGADRLALGRLANENPPRLRTHDPQGRRLDLVEFHPSYHALMAESSVGGLSASTWQGGSHLARAARLYIVSGVEAGHVCPLTMTHAAPAALAAAPALLAEWLPRVRAGHYDGRFLPFWEKSGVTLGMGMTEKQGGTDVRANLSSARPVGGGEYEVAGHKWFFSAPMSDAFLVLAQAPGGLSCFLMPRFRPDGSLNGLHFQRLKDKLGNRSNASAEVEFDRAFAWGVGEEGRGVATILNMVQMTRLDCAASSAGLMRMALAQALHHARHRTVFGKTLISQPAMTALLADMALEVEGAVALVMRLARAFDGAAMNPQEAARARLLTPAVKFLVCKLAPGFIYEAMEALGGNGYVEESPLPRLYREAPVNSIWEGSGNVVALDLLRAASREPEAARALLDALVKEAGGLAGAHETALSLAARLAAPDRERQARSLAEGLATLAAAAALAERAPAPIAEAYAASRLRTGRGMLGTADLGDTADLLLARAFAA
ncbi:acyl-CoA dehydrogenase family protein [Aquabacter sp. P-9]|uniref:acyl-CoA dehydrogenase family protein n=1 Tax=Aquabacter sediminis TaxID=3029197 RepID=UPI00237DF489|nr:acyl-CoA dehydrogenase family protein [Aquabacter sp. P-9]MDE1566932.1 acyl-CoA dehydrogenase family protein [Aquabacter sp. P-9]